ncbi:uncharacterized protein BX664DRAFT_353266 [Halteromyces radiatus]|uniref:uncharacterized protein n=1 Tax=Halteromyces radiatus TaxID=101107 RepID=UPI00221EE7D1|nr:uncharacterized protein BX664DRAFT_353266 [Halteromyces radiatus]KAI8078665.1 hypothetical protein BX664DRAFT_353266 [Halteromyces radiatus]
MDIPPSSSPNKVRGWLMGVQGYREPTPDTLTVKQQQVGNGLMETQHLISNHNNNYSLGNMERRNSISSINSEDSVNLDDLIKANFTLDVDDETDLPNLASLDLDDSKEDFWKMDKELSEYQALVKQKPKEDYRNASHAHTMKELDFVGSIEKSHHLDSPELSWSPPDDHLETLSPIYHNTTTRPRSGSINSDNSLNSYSTVTVQQYSRYGMTPMIYQSDSTSTSSRTPSRLSNYSGSSQTSSNTTTGIPRPRKVSATSTGMPSPSRSFTSRAGEENHLLPRSHSRLGGPSSTPNGRSKLAQRASHIPSPSSQNQSQKSLPRLTSIPSSRSTGIPGARPSSRFSDHNTTTTTTKTGSTSTRKLASRASHIPSVYERSASPISNRTTTTTNSTIRNSVFGLRRDDDSKVSATTATNGNQRRTLTGTSLRSTEQRSGVTPIGGKSTGIRPPTTDVRSSSRIGFRRQ